DIDGTGFRSLHQFEGTPIHDGPITNGDGAYPESGLIVSGRTLFGTAIYGGTSGRGTVFAINTDGSAFTNLHNFRGTSDGATPTAGLILLGNTLYGAATGFLSSGNGTLFALNTNGMGFTTLYSFTATSGDLTTNSDGAAPHGDLVSLGNTVYGTGSAGGSSGNGLVFSLSLPPPQLTLILSKSD